MGTDISVRIPPLARDGNYKAWASSMRALLISKDRLDRLLDAEPGEDENLKERDAVCKATLQLHVTGPLKAVVDRAKTAKQAWDALYEEYLGSLHIRQPQLMASLTSLSQGSLSVVQYIDKAKELRDDFEALEMSSSLPLLCQRFIAGLSDQLLMMCAQPLHALLRDKSKGLDDIASELRSMCLLLPPSVAMANSTQSRQATRPHNAQKETRTCNYCGKVGHLKAACRKYKREKGKPEQAAIVMATTGEGFVSASMDTDALWFDTMATHHVVHSNDKLTNQRPSTISSVMLGGGEKHMVNCEGDLRLDGGPSGPVILTGVLYAPTLKINLCSGPQVANKGGESWQGRDKCTISLRGRTLLEGRMVGNMYKLNCTLRNSGIGDSTAAVNSTSALWHKRLGHPGSGIVAHLVKTDGVKGMGKVEPSEVERDCTVCAAAKQTRESYPRSDHTASKPLELLHSDLMFMPSEALEGEQYVMTVLDDYSRYSETVCLHRKSDATDELVAIIRRLQKQTGGEVKRVRTDQGTEYYGLDKFCKSTGVVHELSATYTPEQNGRAERLNRTLIERVRALLLQFKAPKILWAEAIQVASLVRNCVPVAGDTRSPMEKMFGVKPDISRFRVFGCAASVHIPKKKRDKLDAVAVQGVFVGYATNSKAWKVLVSSGYGSWNIVESSNVQFNESVAGKYPASITTSNTDHEYDDMVTLFLPDKTAEEGPPEAPAEPAEVAESDQEPAAVPEENAIQPPIDEAPAPRRYPQRERHPSAAWYEAKAAELHTTVAVQGLTDNPATYREAMARPDKEFWVSAINEELAALHAKSVYSEVDLPEGAHALPSKFVFTIKRDDLGNIQKYKARLVVKGFRQIAGRDYEEVFAPTAQQATLRIMLAHASAANLNVEQLDVRTAFLNGDLSNEVYLKLPSELGGKIWRLHKALYGLKQAARAWHEKLREQMIKHGFTPSQHDPCLFFRGDGEWRVYIVIHVDDALIFGKPHAGAKAKQSVSQMFDIKDLGPVRYFLGISIQRNASGGYSLSQSKYVNDMLHRFGMTDAATKPTPLPVGLSLSRTLGTALPPDNQYQALVGSLIYLAVNTRPDISHAVGILSRFMSCPTDQHWEAAKHVLRYLKGTAALGLNYSGHKTAKNQGVYDAMYTDADFAADIDKRRSTTGAAMMMQGAAVLWISKLQPIVATSTAEAEYIASATATKEGLWVRKLLGDIHGKVSTVNLKVDNQSAIVLISEHTAGKSGRSKHIDLQFHFVSERFQRGEISVTFVPTADQHADIFTKQLGGPEFRRHRDVVMGNFFNSDSK
jgi:Reverse transcriptase (RNA-dependent DNA polymerase)/Integrase core domain/GAG-pre-integrase domain